MKGIYDLSGQNTPVHKPFLVYGAAADLVEGALVEAPNVAGPTALGAVENIGTVAAPVDIVGVVTQLHDYSVAGEWTYNGDLAVATNRPEIDVDIRPLAVIQSQLTESLTATIYNTNDTTEVGMTFADATPTADDLIGGGWIYDDATEQLRFIEDHDAQTTIALNTATTTAITNAQNRKVVVVPPRLYGSGAGQGFTLSTTYDKIGIDTDETVLWAKVVDVWVQTSKENPKERLNPGIHDAAACSSAKLYADIVIADHAFNVGD